MRLRFRNSCSCSGKRKIDSKPFRFQKKRQIPPVTCSWSVVALGMCKVCKCTGAPHSRSGGGALPVADLENFGGGDLMHKTSRFFGRKRKFKPSVKTFFFFCFWRSPDCGRKKGLNVEKPLLISVKTFFFWRSPDFGRKKGLNVEKPLLISVKTSEFLRFCA